MDKLEWDGKIILPCHVIGAGPSMAGKTKTLLSLLQDRDRLFAPRITCVVIFTREDQKLFHDFKAANPDLRVILRIGEPKDFVQLDQYWDKTGQNILFLDDVSYSTLQSPQLSDAATAIRHKGVSIFMTLHRIFGPSQAFRRTLCNFSIFLLMGTRRMSRDVVILDSQNGLDGVLKTVFNYILSKGYKYLMLDLSTNCPELARYRIVEPNSLRLFVTD